MDEVTDEARTVIVLADRLLPLLERAAGSCHDDNTMTYGLAAALIRRSGERPVPAMLIGKVLAEIAQNWSRDLVAVVVSKETGEPSHGYWFGGGMADPEVARKNAHRALCPYPQGCGRLNAA